MTFHDVRLAAAGGLDADEFALVNERLSRALSRLDDYPGASAEVSRSAPETVDSQLTLEVWLPSLPRLVATSNNGDLGLAAAEVDQRLVAQLDNITGRRRDRTVRRARQHRAKEKSA